MTEAERKAWNEAIWAAARTSDAHLFIDWLDRDSEASRGAIQMQQAISRAIRSLTKPEHRDMQARSGK